MKFASVFALIAMVAAPLAAPSAALAHTKVVASTPAEGTTVGSARVVTLTFNEALLPPTAAASRHAVVTARFMRRFPLGPPGLGRLVRQLSMAFCRAYLTRSSPHPKSGYPASRSEISVGAAGHAGVHVDD